MWFCFSFANQCFISPILFYKAPDEESELSCGQKLEYFRSGLHESECVNFAQEVKTLSDGLLSVCVTHLCMNSMILSLLRSCGSVNLSSPFSKYLRVGKPEILKRSPTDLCSVESTAANTPGLCGQTTTANLKSRWWNDKNNTAAESDLGTCNRLV